MINSIQHFQQDGVKRLIKILSHPILLQPSGLELILSENTWLTWPSALHWMFLSFPFMLICIPLQLLKMYPFVVSTDFLFVSLSVEYIILSNTSSHAFSLFYESLYIFHLWHLLHCLPNVMSLL
jgi:hypothetical protein